MQDVDKGYIDLAGAILRQAVWDYKNLRFSTDGNLTKNLRKRFWEDAKNFLFSTRLEKYIEDLGVEHLISHEAVRKLAK